MFNSSQREEESNDKRESVTLIKVKNYLMFILIKRGGIEL